MCRPPRQALPGAADMAEKRVPGARKSDATSPAALIHRTDWSKTSLGPRDGWASTLRSTVSLVLDSPIGMALMWGEDPVMIYNEGYIAIAGDRHPSAFGETVKAAWPEVWAWNQAVLQRGFRGESFSYRDEHRVVERNGQHEDIWFDLFYAPVRDDAGRVGGVLCTVIDTTAHRMAMRSQSESEGRLARSEARLAMLVNQASVGITQNDLSGRLVAANERFCEIVGRSADDVIGIAFETLIDPGDVEASRAAHAQLLQNGRAYIAEKRLRRADGTSVWVSNHVSLARDAGGHPEFVIWITQDISDRKQAEALARDSSERIQLALSTGAILGTWVWDIGTGLISGDGRFARTLSIEAPDIAGGIPLDTAFAHVHPDDKSAMRSALQASFEVKAPYRAEFRVRGPDGAWLWIEASGHVEGDAEGASYRFPGILINIDQRRRAVERQAFLIALGDRLRTIEEPVAILARTVEETGRHLRARRVAYGEASPDGETVDVLAEWSPNLAPALGRTKTSLFGEVVAASLKSGQAASTQPGQDGNAPTGAGLLAVPLFREGRWHAMMLAEADDGRVWTANETELLREVIGRTWEAVERARAVTNLRKAQGRQAFLLRLNDHLSEIDDPQEVLETVAESLGAYLGVNRASYGEVSLEAKTITFQGAWSDGQGPLLDGLFSYAGIADQEVAELMRGLTVSEDDFARTHPSTPERTALFDRYQIRAVLAVPLIRDGRFRAGLFLAHGTPRRWSLEEISLTQEVARRTWDTLERTRAEQALQRSEARLRAMFDTLPVGIVFAEMPSGRVTEGNARVEQILGYPAFPSLDTAAFEEWIAFDEDGRRVAVEEHPLYIAVTTGETAARTFHHQRGDGTRVWIGVIGAAVRNADGAITGGLLTIMDVDREKRAEAALRELNTTLEHQVEMRTRERDRVWRNSRDLLAVLSSDGVLLAVNPSWTVILGWTSDELVGRPFDAFLHRRDAESTTRVLQGLRDAPFASPFENRFLHKHGNYVWFSWTASIEGDAIYANGRDVTAEKEQAEALRHAEEQLRQSQKMEAVGQLTGGIAHDFNNLLTGITGALDLLGKRISQGRLENTERYIGMAMNSANRAAALTHRLLAFSRRQPLEAKPVDVNRLVTSMDDLLRRTLGEKITLDIVASHDLWLTLCDAHQLENALLNLVINARDAMPDGGRLTIETANASLEPDSPERESGTKPGRYVMLSVSDTGTGMTADVIARAFDPFFTTKPIGQGTGLGLSMIYGFAKQSEGTVRIESQVNEGTTVKLYLPRFRGKLTDLGEAHSEVPREGAGETILIVEDDATVRNLVLEVLQDLGYKALEASDGPSGLMVLQSRQHIDLLVTDVGLPGLNGRQLADQALESRPDLRVLFITGYAENATFGSERLDPKMQMITKPFAVETFAAKIKEMIAGRST